LSFVVNCLAKKQFVLLFEKLGEFNFQSSGHPAANRVEHFKFAPLNGIAHF
jgi:hypothetical protein